MDGKLKPIHGAWIPAIHAGMTILEGMMMKSDKVELMGRQVVRINQVILQYPIL
jgi:hypothetical protein